VEAFKQAFPEWFGQVPADFDIAYVGGCKEDYSRGDPISEHVLRSQLTRCMSSYVISRAGANKMLRYALPTVAPIDITTNMYQEGKASRPTVDALKIYQLVPQMMGQTNQVRPAVGCEAYRG
jgi:hypothetical protein